MKKQSGFTLIELMIVVAIIAILAAIAMPAYQNYIAKAKFSDVINAAGAVKTQVELCYNETTDLSNCANNKSGYSYKLLDATSYANGTNVTSITVASGKVTAVASGATGISGINYILAPTVSGKALTWAVDTSSTCINAELCQKQ